MNKYLKYVAAYLIKRYGAGLSDLSIIFPNRRAGLFFQKYISELIDKAVFSPRIITISEFVADNSTLKLIDRNAAVIELYEVYCQVTGSVEPIDEFYYWGEMLLSDFEDIDKYLVDAKQLFNNIESLKEIDYGFDFLTDEQLKFLSTFWKNIIDSRASENKEQFLQIWKKLYHVYEQYTIKLKKNGLAYEGMLYRQLVDDIANRMVRETGNYVFVGFNALNKCEQKLFDFFRNNKSGLFFWDFDDYYVTEQVHEAGMFVQENLSRYPMPDDFHFNQAEFKHLSEIEVVSIPGFSGQTAYASSWLSENKELISNRFDNTAIVLCDETLLLSMLNSVPESVSELNITMGFPIKSSPAYALLKGLVDIDKNSRKAKDGTLTFYYRNVLALLSNPLLHEYLKEEVDTLIVKIRSENRIYLTINDFAYNELLSLVFNLPEHAQDCRVYLQSILKVLFKGQLDQNNLLKESLYQLYLAINRLHDSLITTMAKHGDLFPKKLYYKLLLRQLDNLTIPFEGEPLSGVQLMGFLETRCLDFDHLILLSFNDNILPGNSHQHSFVPYSLRKGFGLPVIEQRNAMYAYYFYRLIQRAKKVSLVYDARSDGMSGGEVSRFATQLKYEARHLNLIERQGVFNYSPGTHQSILVEKTDSVLDQVETYLGSKRVSPSALNRYLKCRLSFYFRYIEGINESDEVQEDIDQLMFGRVAHKALETIYKPFEGKNMTLTDFESIQKNQKQIRQALNEALKEEYFKSASFELNGRNLLVYDIILKYIIRILNYDKSIAPIHIVSLERNYDSSFSVQLRGSELSVKIGGVIDRLDIVDQKMRVVDYKTGVAKAQITNIEQLFTLEGKNNKAAFQTMLYANCVLNELRTELAVMPAVYGAQSVFQNDFSPLFSISGASLIYQANAAEFEERLGALLNEIADGNIGFDQTSQERTCATCEYNGICNR